MTLPQDPNMLYSVVNMKLRDSYPNLDAMCDDLGVSRPKLEKTLADAGFSYDAASNRFV